MVISLGSKKIRIANGSKVEEKVGLRDRSDLYLERRYERESHTTTDANRAPSLAQISWGQRSKREIAKRPYNSQESGAPRLSNPVRNQRPVPSHQARQLQSALDSSNQSTPGLLQGKARTYGFTGTEASRR